MDRGVGGVGYQFSIESIDKKPTIALYEYFCIIIRAIIPSWLEKR